MLVVLNEVLISINFGLLLFSVPGRGRGRKGRTTEEIPSKSGRSNIIDYPTFLRSEDFSTIILHGTKTLYFICTIVAFLCHLSPG